MPRGNPARSNRSRGTRRSKLVTRTALRNVLRGTKLRCRPDPSPVIIRPWKPQVLVFYGKGVKTFKDADVTQGILTQNGIATLASDTAVVFRPQSFYFWQEVPLNSTTNVPAPLKSPVTLYVHSIIGEGDQTVMTDVGTTTRYAKVAYRWPEASQNITLSSTNTDQILTVSPTDTDQTWVLHLHALWTTQPASQISASVQGTALNVVDFQRLRLSTPSSSHTTVSSATQEPSNPDHYILVDLQHHLANQDCEPK